MAVVAGRTASAHLMGPEQARPPRPPLPLTLRHRETLEADPAARPHRQAVDPGDRPAQAPDDADWQRHRGCGDDSEPHEPLDVQRRLPARAVALVDQDPTVRPARPRTIGITAGCTAVPVPRTGRAAPSVPVARRATIFCSLISVPSSLRSAARTSSPHCEVGEGAEVVDERCDDPPPPRPPQLHSGPVPQVPQRCGLQGDLDGAAAQNRPPLRGRQIPPRPCLPSHDRSVLFGRPPRQRLTVTRPADRALAAAVGCRVRRRPIPGHRQVRGVGTAEVEPERRVGVGHQRRVGRDPQHPTVQAEQAGASTTACGSTSNHLTNQSQRLNGVSSRARSRTGPAPMDVMAPPSFGTLPASSRRTRPTRAGRLRRTADGPHLDRRHRGRKPPGPARRGPGSRAIRIALSDAVEGRPPSRESAGRR